MKSCAAKTTAVSPSGRALPRPAQATLVAARKRLLDAGQTVTTWAEQNGERREQVSKVLSGTRACISGEAHRIAVKLGIKDGTLPQADHA